MNKITGVNTKNETYNFIGKLNAVGRDGVGLDFHWDGTKLGIKKENEDTFEYVDLQGDTQMIDELTKEHIVNALGYEPLDAANLDELEATVGKHTLQLNELIEMMSTKANIEDIPTKLSDLEIDIEIGDGSSEDIEKLKLEIKRLDEVKAEINYVDELINTLDKETNVEISDLKRHLENTKARVTKLELKLDKNIETINNELSNKADIEHIHTDYEDDIMALKSKTDELKDMIENIDVPEGVDLRPVYEKIEQLEKNKADKAELPTQLSDLQNDVGYITADEVDLTNVEGAIEELNQLVANKADKEIVNKAISNLQEQIDELDIPEEVDLTAIENDIANLKENKADKSYVDNITQHIMNQLTQMIVLKADKSFVDKEIERLESLVNDIDVPEEVDLQPIYNEIEELKLVKSDKTTVQSEIDRLEKMIGELAGGGEIDLSDYALKKDIPKSLSQLTNDTGYITIADIPEVDLTDINKQLIDLQNNKANKSDVAEDINKLQQEIDNLDIPEEVDLKPIQDSLELLKENKADISYVQSEVDKLNESITNVVSNISEDYALKDELPTKLSDLQNDTGYITADEIDLTEIENNLTELEDRCTALELEKSDIVYVDNEIKKIRDLIDNIDIPEDVDLRPILERIEELEEYINTELTKKVDKVEYISDIREIQDKLSNHGLSITELNGEIVIVNSELEKKADTTYVDTRLNGYYKKSETYTRDEINSRIAEIIGNAPENLDTLEKLAKALDNDDSFASSVTKELSNKVDKESGKGLSSNDFTNTYKLKLDGIEKGANRVEKLSDLVNDKGYITLDEVPKVDLTPYATKSEVENKLSDINIKDDEQDKKIQAIQDLIDGAAEGMFIDDSKTESSTAGSYNKGVTISSVSKADMPSINSDSMLITVKTGLSKNAGQICIDENGLLYGRKANFFAAWGEWVSGEEVDLSQIHAELDKLEREKANQEEMILLQNHIESMSEIVQYKADIDYVEREINKINNIIEDLNIPNLEPIELDIKDLQNNKADKEKLISEVARLEQMITEIIEGEDSQYIVPRVTNNPIAEELFYKETNQESPRLTWDLDDNGAWEIIDDNHLKVVRKATDNLLHIKVKENSGRLALTFSKTAQAGRHTIVQKRNDKTIMETGSVRGDSDHNLNIQVDDIIIINAMFDGDVYFRLKGERENIRLSAYKNGKIEEIANKRLVEERLEDFSTRDEVNSKIGKLDELATNEKGNIVDAINEIYSKGNGKVQPRVTMDYDENEIHVHTVEKPEFTVGVTNITNDVTQDGNRFTVEHEEGYSKIELSITSGKGDISLDFLEAAGYYSYTIYFVDKDRYSSGWIKDIDVFTHSIKEGDRISISTGSDLVFQYIEPKLVSEKTIYFEGQPINKEYDDTDIRKDILNVRNDMRLKADKSELPTKLSELENDLNLGGGSGVTSVNGLTGDVELTGDEIQTSNDNLTPISSQITILSDTKAEKSEIPTKLSELENDIEMGSGNGVTSVNDLTGDVELDAYNIPINSNSPSWTINNELSRKASAYEVGELKSALFGLEDSKAEKIHTHNISDINGLESRLDELKKSVSDGKSRVADSITQKGVATENTDSFETMADNILQIKSESKLEGYPYGSEISPQELMLEYENDEGFEWQIPLNITMGRGMSCDNRGNVYICYNNLSDYTLLKISENADILKRIDFNSEAETINNVMAHNGYVYVVGSANIYKCSEDLDVLDELPYKGNITAIEKYNHRYLIIGMSRISSHSILFLDTFNFSIIELEIKYRKDVDIIKVDRYGDIYLYLNRRGDRELVKISVQGEEVWSYQLDNMSLESFIVADKEIILLTSLSIVTISLSGELISSQEHSVAYGSMGYDNHGYMYQYLDGVVDKINIKTSQTVWTEPYLSSKSAYYEILLCNNFTYVFLDDGLYQLRNKGSIKSAQICD